MTLAIQENGLVKAFLLALPVAIFLLMIWR